MLENSAVTSSFTCECGHYAKLTVDIEKDVNVSDIAVVNALAAVSNAGWRRDAKLHADHGYEISDWARA